MTIPPAPFCDIPLYLVAVWALKLGISSRHVLQRYYREIFFGSFGNGWSE